MGSNDYFLADDLSGALDAAAAFHHAGRRVRIVLAAAAWGEAQDREVVGITTETRNADPERAAQVVRQVLTMGSRRGAKLVYKKIDSTLRGPVAAETRAVMEALPGARVLFAPANPRVGRTVRDGTLLVQGVPVAQTAFGRDPGSPLRASSIREILGAAATPAVVIPDVATEADLAAAVRQMDAAAVPWVPIGSGALAVPVAAAAGGGPASARTAVPAVPGSPVLMLGGSAHPLNRDQAARLAAVHGLPLHEVAVDAGAPLTPEVVTHLRDRRACSLLLPLARTAPTVALRAIVAAAVRAIDAAGVHRLFVTGGETAFALCAELGIRSLVFVDELEPGLSLAVGNSRRGPMLLAVKPGGFGDAETWIRAWRRLHAA